VSTPSRPAPPDCPAVPHASPRGLVELSLPKCDGCILNANFTRREIAAARLPNSGISEIAVNASLALIEGAKPQGEIEAALVLQMACTHAAAMAVLATFAGGHGPDRNMAAKASAAGRLLRAYATQVETLRRLRNGGSQIVRVEHVHINEGGQALIGNVRKDGSARAEGES
jgi:hypothetical protein